MGVSKNSGTPKSSIINHPFWGTTIFGNIHIHNLSFSALSLGVFPIKEQIAMKALQPHSLGFHRMVQRVDFRMMGFYY